VSLKYEVPKTGFSDNPMERTQTFEWFSQFKSGEMSVEEICTLLLYYAASSGNTLPMFWDNISVPSSRVKKSKKTLEDATDMLSRNVGKALPLNAA
jgi:hypothetical protein